MHDIFLEIRTYQTEKNYYSNEYFFGVYCTDILTVLGDGNSKMSLLYSQYDPLITVFVLILTTFFWVTSVMWCDRKAGHGVSGAANHQLWLKQPCARSPLESAEIKGESQRALNQTWNHGVSSVRRALRRGVW